MLYWSHYCECSAWRHVTTLMTPQTLQTLQTLLTRHFRRRSCVAGICIWNDGGRTKCQNVVFLPRTASELPPAKSVEAQSSAHQCDKRQSHISSSAFSSLLLVLAGLGWAGLGWARRGADITHCVLWRVDKLSAGQHLPRTLYLYSHYLHYLHYIYRVIIFTIYRVIVYIIYLQISTPSLSAAAQDKVVVATSQFCSLHKWNCNFPDHRPTEMQAPCPALQK